jgi:hypothetical protein
MHMVWHYNVSPNQPRLGFAPDFQQLIVDQIIIQPFTAMLSTKSNEHDSQLVLDGENSTSRPLG